MERGFRRGRLAAASLGAGLLLSSLAATSPVGATTGPLRATVRYKCNAHLAVVTVANRSTQAVEAFIDWTSTSGAFQVTRHQVAPSSVSRYRVAVPDYLTITVSVTSAGQVIASRPAADSCG